MKVGLFEVLQKSTMSFRRCIYIPLLPERVRQSFRAINMLLLRSNGKNDFDLSGSAATPDVRRRYVSQVSLLQSWGLAPGPAFGPNKHWAEPEPGA